MFRRHHGVLQVLLGHPGGPFWTKKDDGAWTIPKGEYDSSEDSLAAAKREFGEETGFAIEGPFLPLGSLKQPTGKILAAWAFESDCDPDALASNTFEIEWPPKSGRKATFPEIDRVGWFGIDDARQKLHRGQEPFLHALETVLSDEKSGRSSQS